MNDPVLKKLTDFFSKYPAVEYKKGQKIIRAYDQITSIYFLEKGFVRQFVTTKDGEDITLHVFRNFSYFPIMLVLGKSPNKYIFESVMNAVTRKAPAQDVVAFLKKDQDVLFDLTSRFAEGLIGLLLKIESELYKDALEKVTAVLVYLSDTFAEQKNGHATIGLPFTHTDIASWVGIQRETVSRQMEKLEKQGFIKHEKNFITILKGDQLKKLIAEE